MNALKAHESHQIKKYLERMPNRTILNSSNTDIAKLIKVDLGITTTVPMITYYLKQVGKTRYTKKPRKPKKNCAPQVTKPDTKYSIIDLAGFTISARYRLDGDRIIPYPVLHSPDGKEIKPTVGM